MIRRTSVLAATLVAALTCWACQSNAKDDGPVADRQLATTAVARGQTSGVMERGVRVLRSQAELDAFWDEHGRLEVPDASAPPIDFASSMVVAAFTGQCMSGGFAIAIKQVVAVAGHRRKRARIVVEVMETAPDPGGVATMAITSPYDIVVVERAAGEATLLSPRGADS